jgi:hypothetical protein
MLGRGAGFGDGLDSMPNAIVYRRPRRRERDIFGVDG